MVRIAVGKSVRMVPERVARMISALVGKAERIEAAHTGSIAINWCGNAVKAKISEVVEVPRSPAK